MKECYLWVAVVLLSVLSMYLLIDKQVHKYATIHNDTNSSIVIGDRLIVEAIDNDGTMHIAPEEQSNTIALEPQLIWNDDAESIPMEGSKVVVEMILGNKVYLAPLD